MKKVILGLVVVMCLGLSANAQDEKMWIGGALGFGSVDVKGASDKATTFNFSPQWGMMLNDNWGVGVDLSFENYKKGEAKSSNWMVMPYARYYVGITENFKFFGDGLVGFGAGETEEGTDFDQLKLGVRPGFQYWFSSKFSMATTFGFLGYEKVEEEVSVMGATGTAETSKFGLDFTPASVSFGLYFHF